jgi:hypothetical protein
MRINMMTKENDDAYGAAIKKEESVLFDETDKDHEDQTISFDKKELNESSTSLSRSDS